MDEIDLLQVDRNGRLYWDGKPVEVSRRLTFWQSVGAFIVGTFVVIGSVGSFLQAGRFITIWRVGWAGIPLPLLACPCRRPDSGTILGVFTAS
jgi:hypothetical protein